MVCWLAPGRAETTLLAAMNGQLPCFNTVLGLLGLALLALFWNYTACERKCTFIQQCSQGCFGCNLEHEVLDASVQLQNRAMEELKASSGRQSKADSEQQQCICIYICIRVCNCISCYVSFCNPKQTILGKRSELVSKDGFVCVFCQFLATLVALHLTPVSESVIRWAEFRTSVASRLASLLICRLPVFVSAPLSVIVSVSRHCTCSGARSGVAGSGA